MRNEIKELELKLRSIVGNNNAYLSEILNEEARAVKHNGDTYFANCDLNVWKILF